MISSSGPVGIVQRKTHQTANFRFAATVAGVVLSSVLMFAAQAAEYSWLEHMTLAAGLAVVALLITFTTLGFAITIFRNSTASRLLTLAFLFAIVPFVVDWTLRANQTQLNVHGLAMLGFLGYAALCELGCVSMVAAVIAKAVRRARSHP